MRGGASVFGRPVALFDALTHLMNSIGTLWVFAMMFMICADILSRNLFNYPLNGVPEIIGFSIVGSIYLQLANTLHAGRFTRAELLIEWLETNRPFAACLFNAIFNAVGVAIFVLLVMGFWKEFHEVWLTDEIAGVPGTITFIVWPFDLLLVIGAGATAIEFAIRALRSLAGAFDRTAAVAADGTPHRRGHGWLIAFFAFVVAVYLISTVDLTNVQIGGLSILCMLVLIYAGMPIGIALITLGFCGIWMMKGNTIIAERLLSQAAAEYMKNYFFGVVPLFVLMGLLVSASDVGRETFQVARWALQRVRGGLGIATVAANAVFAAITGSSIASAAVFTRVAGSSVLGMLIPPSLLLIVYGFLSEQSVGILFIAAIVPGLILAFAFALLILAMATWRPQWITVAGASETVVESETGWSAFRKLAPILALVVLVIGGIYDGWFTPTEAGAAGSAGALVIGLLKRRLPWRTLWSVLIETGHITVSILFLILAANIYARMLALSGLPQQMGEFIGGTSLGFVGFIALYVLVLIILGMFLDSISIMLIILPLALPVLEKFGGDPIWFGIVTVIAVEIGLLTPPLGLTCYVVKSTLNDDRITLNQIFLGATPFAAIMLLVTILLIAVPKLSLLFL